MGLQNDLSITNAQYYNSLLVFCVFFQLTLSKIASC